MSIGRNSQIWRGLVEYANEASIEAEADALKMLAKTLWESMGWMSRTAFDSETDVPQMIAQQVQPGLKVSGSNGPPPWVVFRSEKQLSEQFHQEAIQFQPAVRQMLRWLADPNKNMRDRDVAFRFLREHSKHIEFQRGDPAFAPEDEELRYFTLEGELTANADFPYRTFRYKDIADVICDFVHREHEAGKAPPLQICKRPGCGNPVASIKKRQFCRTAACDKERQKRDDDDQKRKNRDALVLWRLRHQEPGTRRGAIRKRVERLRAIESYWRDKNSSLSAHARNLLRQIQVFTEGTTHD